MKKVDFICLILSIIINLLLIFLFVNFKEKPLDTNETLKIGLIAVKNNESTVLPNKKNTDSKAEVKQKEEHKEIEKKEEKKVEEKTKTIEKESKLEKEVKEITKENKKEEKKTKENKAKKPSLDDLKKSIAASSKNLFKQDKGEDEETDRILGTLNSKNGIVGGSKFGSAEGTIVADWNASNQKPKFPESAEQSGKNGQVVILIRVDEYGNVTSYHIEKGSGVPEIDSAIEKVASSWKINLKRKDKNIAGSFYINYNFNFK